MSTLDRTIIAGDFTYGLQNIQYFGCGEGAKISIGKFCSIAHECKIYIGGNHNVNWITTYPFGHIHTTIFNSIDGY